MGLYFFKIKKTIYVNFNTPCPGINAPSPKQNAVKCTVTQSNDTYTE